MGLDENLEFHQEAKELDGDMPGGGPGEQVSPLQHQGTKSRDRTGAPKGLVSAAGSGSGPRTDDSLKAQTPVRAGRAVLSDRHPC